MLKERITKIYLHRRMIKDMVVIYFKTKYSGSKLGIWWALLTPLILAYSINFIFTNISKVSIPNFTIFVLAGIMPWIFFTNSLNEVTNAFIANVSILRQAIFPSELVPLSSILANFINFVIRLLVLLPLFILFNPHLVTVIIFILPLLFFQLLFIVGIGFIFSSWNLFFRDLPHLLSIGFIIWFWVTPVFYPLEAISFPFRWICLLNPMTYYVIAYQEIIFQARMPSLWNMMILSSTSLIFFILGYVFFIKNEAELLKKICTR